MIRRERQASHALASQAVAVEAVPCNRTNGGDCKRSGHDDGHIHILMIEAVEREGRDDALFIFDNQPDEGRRERNAERGVDQQLRRAVFLADDLHHPPATLPTSNSASNFARRTSGVVAPWFIVTCQTIEIASPSPWASIHAV